MPFLILKKNFPILSNRTDKIGPNISQREEGDKKKEEKNQSPSYNKDLNKYILFQMDPF